MFFRNKKSQKSKVLLESTEYENIKLKLECLLRDNRELHRCLYKLHSQLLGQINELKELSRNNTMCSTFLDSPVPSPRQKSDKRVMKEVNRKLQKL